MLQTTFMFSKRSIRDGNEFSLPLFSDAEVASSYFMFTGQLSLVNSLKEVRFGNSPLEAPISLGIRE